ncbi:MAG: dTMP kinase [Spirochaetes bacterium]|nr:dTMP kinase [Spirochaetota bacterium]MBU0953820.1 dTMP kinase [Spirochaetota bacterium]
MHHNFSIIPGFVVFEGIDGSGTSTQLQRLAQRLLQAQIQHRIDAEPTKGPIGRLIRIALSGELTLHPHTVAHLFAADRNEHVQGKAGIIETCSQGKLVISDRYIFSSLAYQGLTCGPELPGLLNAAFPLPELLFFFSLPAETGMERMKNRSSLEIYEKLDFQQQVAAAYEQVLSEFSASKMRLIQIDASRDMDSISEQIWQETSKICARFTGS